MLEVTIADVMQAYATDAVAYAKHSFNVALDFSEQSLEVVDRILDDYRESGLLAPDDLSSAEREELWSFCKTLGGYVGEVIIRNIGGEWRTKDVGDGAATVSLVTTGGVEFSPPEAVWHTLTEPDKSIVAYYRALKTIEGYGDEKIEDGIRTVHLPTLSARPAQASEVSRRPWWKFW